MTIRLKPLLDILHHALTQHQVQLVCLVVHLERVVLGVHLESLEAQLHVCLPLAVILSHHLQKAALNVNEGLGVFRQHVGFLQLAVFV